MESFATTRDTRKARQNIAREDELIKTLVRDTCIIACRPLEVSWFLVSGIIFHHLMIVFT